MVRDDKSPEGRLRKSLRLLAPGTTLYEGLENVLRARTGALIVVGDSEEVLKLCDGGFRIDGELNPANLYELAKMDGAIIVSRDARRILLANTHLAPDPLIPSLETGTRHRTAQRVAIQTGELVIAISQRRNVITLYQGPAKYVLQDIGVILAKANQALQTLEKYKSVLEQVLTNLTALEFEDLATAFDVATALQRTQMVARIANEIERYIAELGSEGRLVSMQLDELMVNIEDEGLLVVRDYLRGDGQLKPEAVWEQLLGWNSDDLLDLGLVMRALGYGGGMNALETLLTPRGYRILTKIPRLPLPVIDNLVAAFGTLPKILEASIDQLDQVEGIGEVRARAIKEGLRRLREQTLIDRHV
ncbi:MAG TPA: DNA integrity scanning protein DisA [Firmicutes bacterium]|nr:DNA integrity scanning protein DisA [Bacillota bacterium]